MTVPLGENERIDDLGGELKLIQSPSTPCFAIDAVLLADFVREAPTPRIVDLGCGNGVIPLLLSRRMPGSQIAGLELMPQMCDQASRSVELNGLSSQIEIISGDLREISSYLPAAATDIVTANPPYYQVGHGRSNQSEIFAAARQEAYCGLNDVLAATAYLLRPLGRLYLVHRAGRLAEIMAALPAHGLRAERLRSVQPSAAKTANLVLLEAKKGGRAELVIMPPLIVYAEPGQYTEEMRRIYGR
jgi:tRNA1Val (adenine37-N6)-methyltransferase